jgi:hypothetical protein
MSLNRTTLAKVDRRVLAELDHTEGTQLVKVPVSDAVWSTWRRFCDAAGVTMGRGLAVLLAHELAAVAEVDLETLVARLEEREAEVAAQAEELDERERAVRRREHEVAVKERASVVDVEGLIALGRTPPKRGRNEPCWCGSDLKYKFCHDRRSNK